jgi:hypothetical protein
MNAGNRYEIDDTEQVRPHIRLCHRILSEALAAGFTTVELCAVPGEGPNCSSAERGLVEVVHGLPAGGLRPAYRVLYTLQLARSCPLQNPGPLCGCRTKSPDPRSLQV